MHNNSIKINLTYLLKYIGYDRQWLQKQTTPKSQWLSPIKVERNRLRGSISSSASRNNTAMHMGRLETYLSSYWLWPWHSLPGFSFIIWKIRVNKIHSSMCVCVCVCVPTHVHAHTHGCERDGGRSRGRVQKPQKGWHLIKFYSFAIVSFQISCRAS